MSQPELAPHTYAHHIDPSICSSYPRQRIERHRIVQEGGSYHSGLLDMWLAKMLRMVYFDSQAAKPGCRDNNLSRNSSSPDDRDLARSYLGMLWRMPYSHPELGNLLAHTIFPTNFPPSIYFDVLRQLSTLLPPNAVRQSRLLPCISCAQSQHGAST